MKLIAISDLHYDEAEEKAEQGIENVIQNDSDVLLVGGDIARTKETLHIALDQLKQFPGVKLAYLGNHELRALEESVLGEHYQEMGSLFRQYGFHLLDEQPFLYRRIGFVGNVGWFDYSLYRGDHLEEERKKADSYFVEKYDSNGMGPREFTEHCVARVKSQILSLEGRCDSIYLGIHHIAFPEFLKYGHSRLYDFKNLIMGSDRLRHLYEHPKVKAGFCGHTHRSGEIEVFGKKVYNVSLDGKGCLELEV